MTRRVKIVALAGSLSSPSTSLAAARLALAGASEAGADVEVLDLRALDLPMYAPEHGQPPASVRKLIEVVADADGLIWASPMYHGTISGAFKNALDWLQLLADAKPAYLTDKVVGLVATAGGVQGLQAINTMEYVVRSLRGHTFPMTVPVSRAWEVFDDAGQASDPAVEQQLRSLGAEVTRMAARLSPRASLAEAA